MKVGLIDVDGHNYPNIALMKISAYHKAKGDSVEWYEPLFSGHMDKVYMSKVFSFTPEYPYYIDADMIIKGGTGYAIKQTATGREFYDREHDTKLPEYIEHIYPDYGIYPEKTGYGKPLNEQTAFGFLTRGCPRDCSFCHVTQKEGHCSTKVADLSEFWHGQGNIELLDPNILACKDWEDLLGQLIASGAGVNFNQGLDIRVMTQAKAEALALIKTNKIHFAWDKYEDREFIEPRFKEFRRLSKINNHRLQVYVLCGDRERRVRDEDLYRIYWLRDNGFAPYVMLYDKANIPRGHELRRLQRYVNNRIIFWSCDSFENYMITRERKHEQRENRIC